MEQQQRERIHFSYHAIYLTYSRIWYDTTLPRPVVYILLQKIVAMHKM